jgi:hypothetical protein
MYSVLALFITGLALLMPDDCENPFSLEDSLKLGFLWGFWLSGFIILDLLKHYNSDYRDTFENWFDHYLERVFGE